VGVKLIEKTNDYIIIELAASGTFNNAKIALVTQGQLNYDYNVASQFMASDTAVICVEQFTTRNGFIYVDSNVFSFGGIDCGWNSTIRGILSAMRMYLWYRGRLTAIYTARKTLLWMGRRCERRCYRPRKDNF
jgi:hypothetical protein